MRATRNATLLAMLVAASFLPSAEARAQKHDARTLKRRAYDFMQMGKLAEAEKVLLTVLRRWPSAKTHKNLALVYLKMGNDERARAHLEEYLVRDPKAYDRPWAEQQIRDCKDRIRRRPVEVTVTSTPSGATVFLDDAARAAGATPLKMAVATGNHVLRVRLAGRKDVLRPIHVVAARPFAVEVGFPEIAKEGVLQITADVEGARVFIDGAPGAFGENSVKPGIHQIRVSKGGHKTWEAQINIEAGERKLAAARLPALSPPVSALVTVTGRKSSASAPVVTGEKRRWTSVLGWVTSGLVVGAATAGAIWWYRSKSDGAAADRVGPRDPGYAKLKSSAQNQLTLANASLIAAGGFAAGSLALHLYSYFSERRRARAETTLRIQLRPVFAGAVVEGGARF